MTTISNTPHLVVIRGLDNGTELHEFWVLQSHFWGDPQPDDPEPVVNCYVAPWAGTRDTTSAGVPPKDKRAGGAANWKDVPEDVKQEFHEEAQRINRAMAFTQTE